MKIKTTFSMLTFIVTFFVSFHSFASRATCPLLNGINVNTNKQILNICKRGAVIKTFRVALGFKGVGKKIAGDNKTPLGLYGLAYPRASSHFKFFIPILYPTSRQAAEGYTGRDVGIHGPTQTSGWLRLQNLPSSTRGCIAVGKNNYIEYLANWVKANPGTKVLII